MRTLLALLVCLLVYVQPASAQVPYESLILKAAQARSVPPRIALKLVQVESSYRRAVVSHRGAIGLTQVMPATGLAVCGMPPHRLFRPWPNLYCGLHYLRLMYERHGTWDQALRAYNVGPTRLASAPHLGGGYANSVLRD